MKKQINMRLDVDVVRSLKKFAKCQKKSFTQLVTDILWKHVQEQRKIKESKIIG